MSTRWKKVLRGSLGEAKDVVGKLSDAGIEAEMTHSHPKARIRGQRSPDAATHTVKVPLAEALRAQDVVKAYLAREEQKLDQHLPALKHDLQIAAGWVVAFTAAAFYLFPAQGLACLLWGPLATLAAAVLWRMRPWRPSTGDAD